MTEHIICQIVFPVNIFCLFFIVVIILYHNVMLCFWTSHYIISTFLITTNNTSSSINIQLSRYAQVLFFPSTFLSLGILYKFQPCINHTVEDSQQNRRKCGPSLHLSSCKPLQSWENQRECPLGKVQGLSY